MTTTSASAAAAAPSAPATGGTLRQAVLHRPNDLRIEEVPIRELQPGDVLLRVDAALLCGTDVRIYQGRKQKNVTFPTVLGHEFAGTVVDANGPLPDGVAMGDQVAVYPLGDLRGMRGLPQGPREHLPQPEGVRLPAHRRPVPVRAGPGRGPAKPGAGARGAGHPGRHHRTGGVRLQRAETGRHAARARPRSSSAAGRSD